ncbi:MAG: PmoA family protein [Planctomycetota bacterium]|nr:PmoA family protein [Planctomycetota bacterium]
MSHALHAVYTPHLLSLHREPGGPALVTQHAMPDTRPFLHPLRAPDLAGELTEDAPGHHPWQHGLYVGLHHVNGLDYWSEQWAKHGRGYFHPRPLVAPRLEGRAAAWEVVTDWRDEKGGEVLVETQGWRLEDRGETYALDMNWTLRAIPDVAFGKHPYGGLFLRMPYRKERGGEALDSEGRLNAAAEQQRSKWVAVSLPIEGRDARGQERGDWCGVALLDHPANAEHPAPWRVDGQLGIAPSRCIAGEWKLPAGREAAARYRVLVFAGPAEPARIAREWDAFARS